MNKLTRTNHRLDTVVAAFQLFRDLRPKMPIQTAFVFLLIARQPGIRLREIEELSGLSQASVSRNIAALCKVDHTGEAGLGLVKRTMDSSDPRVQRIKLTGKGKELALKLAYTMG